MLFNSYPFLFGFLPAILRLYISPNHARSFEAIRLMGWWSQFEAWERGLVAVLEEDRRVHPGQQPIPLWDFGGYTSVTTDPVVAAQPSATGFRLYADSIHFKTDVSYMLIDRMFATASAQKLPGDFGVLLTSDTIEDRLAAMREGQRRYEAANGEDIAAIARMLESLGRLKVARPARARRDR